MNNSYVVFVDFPNKLVGNTWLGKLFIDGKGQMNDFIKDDLLPVGHSGVLYINGESGEINYSEFGRFDDREGHLDRMGRIIIRKKNNLKLHGVSGVTRSSNTNPNILGFNTKPKYENTELSNINEILKELRDMNCFYNNVKDQFITPYDVIVAASLKVQSNRISQVKSYVKKMESKGAIHYGAPHKMYCSKYARNVIRKGGYRIPWYIARGISTVDFLINKYGAELIEIEPDKENEKITNDIFNLHYEKLLMSRNITSRKKFIYKSGHKK